ncbi:MAG: hypothetical protein Q8932_10575 [Bacteroidota bacterium]|nr:hypothetical protein [Bacteroidota bacterium]
MSVLRFPVLACSLLLVACSFFSAPCRAQDLDFPDYRNKKDNFSRIQDKMMRADIASFALAGVDESIGKAQLKTVPLKEYGPAFMKFEGPDVRGELIQVTIRTGTFDPAKHKLMVVDKHLLRIDGHPYYGGNYGETPKTSIESVIVVVGKDTVPVPREAYSDLYDPKFSFREGGANRTRNGVYLSADKNSHLVYIYMLNVENGGSEFTWVIQNRQYLRRVVDFGMLPK